MVYDCFMINDETDLLEIRLNILYEYVDFFVINEATTTQMGKERELLYPKIKNRLMKFQNKIIFNITEDRNINFNNQWEREKYQKNNTINGLKNANDSDIVLFSDVDEIPNPEKIKLICDNFENDKIYHFAQRMFNFYLNYENVENFLLAYCNDYDWANPKRWLGTKMCTYKIAKEKTMDGLRSPERLKEPGIRIEDGGWHFSYCGGDNSNIRDRVKHKLSSFSHSEYNKWKYYNYFHIIKSVKEGKDLLGRNAIFKKVEIDDTFPKWLLLNYKNYKGLILK